MKTIIFEIIIKKVREWGPRHTYSVMLPPPEAGTKYSNICLQLVKPTKIEAIGECYGGPLRAQGYVPPEISCSDHDQQYLDAIRKREDNYIRNNIQKIREWGPRKKCVSGARGFLFNYFHLHKYIIVT